MYANSLKVYSDIDFSKSVIFHEQAKDVIFYMKRSLELLYPAYNAPLRSEPFDDKRIPWMLNESGEELDGRVLEFTEGYSSEYDIGDKIGNLSTGFPDLIFELTTHVDSYDEHYKRYYQNGKMKYCPGYVTIQYEPFESADWELPTENK